jgi:siroheme synthase-like protein
MGSEIPVFLASLVVEGRPCLVVGGGRIATRKVEGLLSAGADVTVIAPDIVPEITGLPVRTERRAYRRGDASRYRLVFAATGRPEIDRLVFEDGERSGVFVNAADDRASCSFLVPAVLRRGPVSVAVSTGGTSPALAVWLRRRVAELVGPEIGTLAHLLEQARAEVRYAGISTESLDWSSLIDGVRPALHTTAGPDGARPETRSVGVAALVADGRIGEAERLVGEWLAGVLGRAPAVPA